MRKKIQRVLSMMILAVLAGTICPQASAEYETVYVLCNPDSYVNIRETPSKKGFCGGRAYCGDDFRTDGKQQNGFVHVFAGTELGEGWISKGFIVYCKPEKCEDSEKWVVESNGRVAARSTIGGKRNRWLRNGAEIKVYYIAEIAVTNYGFVDAQYVYPVQADFFQQ